MYNLLKIAKNAFEERALFGIRKIVDGKKTRAFVPKTQLSMDAIQEGVSRRNNWAIGYSKDGTPHSARRLLSEMYPGTTLKERADAVKSSLNGKMNPTVAKFKKDYYDRVDAERPSDLTKQMDPRTFAFPKDISPGPKGEEGYVKHLFSAKNGVPVIKEHTNTSTLGGPKNQASLLNARHGMLSGIRKDYMLDNTIFPRSYGYSKDGVSYLSPHTSKRKVMQRSNGLVSMVDYVPNRSSNVDVENELKLMGFKRKQMDVSTPHNWTTQPYYVHDQYGTAQDLNRNISGGKWYDPMVNSSKGPIGVSNGLPLQGIEKDMPK